MVYDGYRKCHCVFVTLSTFGCLQMAVLHDSGISWDRQTLAKRVDSDQMPKNAASYTMFANHLVFY